MMEDIAGYLPKPSCTNPSPLTIPVMIRLWWHRAMYKWTFYRSTMRALPGLKCGTALAATFTESPVFGLRPTRGSR